MPQKQKNNIKHSLIFKILMPVVLLALFLLVSNNYILIKQYKASSFRILKHKKTSIEYFISEKIEEKRGEFEKIAQIIINDERILDAYKNNRPEVFDNLEILKLFKENNNVNISFYKFPNSHLFSSKKDSELAEKNNGSDSSLIISAYKKRNSLFGFYAEKESINLLYIKPIIDRWKVLGAIKISYKVNNFIAKPLKKIFDTEAALILRKNISGKRHLQLFDLPFEKSTVPENFGENSFINILKKEGEFIYTKTKIKDSLALFSIEIPSVQREKEQYFLTIGINYKELKSSFTVPLNITLLTSMILVLLSIFILYLTLKKVLITPLNNINEIIKEISLNENIKNRKFEITTEDELGTLMESFNNLILRTSDLFEFKETIEEDSSIEDVFKRIEYILKDKFEIENYTIYLINNTNDKMSIVSPRKEKMWCSHEILLNPSLCRAKRIGKIVNSSEDFPEICPYFRGENVYHICIPIYFQESVGAILQIIYNKEQAEKIQENRALLLNYIKEASPVLEAKQLMKSLKETVMRDPLTGIYNRRFLEEFEEHLTAQAVRDKIKFGVLMLDIDHFKRVNDKYGHDIGDFVLKEVVEVFHNTIRRLDMVFRYGGEEFLIVLNNIQKRENAIKVAEKIRSNLENHEFKKLSIKLPKITISIGVAIFPEDSEDFWKVVKKADIALYKAKETGRNKVIPYDESMAEEEEDSD